MPTPQLFQTAVGIAKETTAGTGVAPTEWLPCENPRFQPQALRHVVDNGYRGVAAVDFDVLPGPGEGTFAWGGNFYVDSVPHLLMNLFGTDTITGAGPYTHPFALSAAPPTHTVEWQQGIQSYWFQYARVQALTINFSARDGALSYTVSGISKLGITHASTTKAFSTQQANNGWNGTVTIAAGAPSGVLMEGSLTFTRQQKVIHGLAGTQDASAIYPLGLQVTGRLTFDYIATTEWAYYAGTAVTQNAIVLTFTQAAATRSVAFTITKAAWRQVDIEGNDGTNTAVAQLNGIYNATDVGPAASTVINARATAY